MGAEEEGRWKLENGGRSEVRARLQSYANPLFEIGPRLDMVNLEEILNAAPFVLSLVEGQISPANPERSPARGRTELKDERYAEDTPWKN